MHVEKSKKTRKKMSRVIRDPLLFPFPFLISVRFKKLQFHKSFQNSTNSKFQSLIEFASVPTSIYSHHKWSNSSRRNNWWRFHQFYKWIESSEIEVRNRIRFPMTIKFLRHSEKKFFNRSIVFFLMVKNESSLYQSTNSSSSHHRQFIQKLCKE